MKSIKLSFLILTIALLSIAIGCSGAGDEGDSSPKRVYRFNHNSTIDTSFNLYNLFSPKKLYADTSSFHKAIYNEDNQVRKVERWNSGTYEGYWEYTFNAEDKLSERKFYDVDSIITSTTTYSYNGSGNIETYVSEENTTNTTRTHTYDYDAFQRLIVCEWYVDSATVGFTEYLKERWVYEYEGDTDRIIRAYQTRYSNPNVAPNYHHVPVSPYPRRAEYNYPDGYTVEKEIYANAIEGDETSGTYAHTMIYTYDDQGRIVSWEDTGSFQKRIYTYSIEEGVSEDPKEWVEWYQLGDEISTELNAPM